MKIILETERLILREIELSDADGMFELDSDPSVHRYLGKNVLTNKEQAIDIIHSVRHQYAAYGIGRWAVMDKNTKEFIGWTGLKFVTTLTNQHINYYDIGYRLLPRYWGKGIATESAQASLTYAFETLHLKEIFGAASCENTSSNKILKKLGLRFVETFYYKDILCNWYAIKSCNS